MPKPQGRASDRVWSIRVGGEVLLLALAESGSLDGAPKDQASQIRSAVDRLRFEHSAIDEVRRVLRSRATASSRTAPSTGPEVLTALGRAIGRGDIKARLVGFARRHDSMREVTRGKGVQDALAFIAREGMAPRPVVPTSSLAGRPLSPAPTAGVAERPLRARVEEIVRRGKARGGARLRGVFDSADAIDLLAAGVVAATPAIFERGDWLADRTINAIGFAYAGLESFGGLGDVRAFADGAQRARSEADLDAGADALVQAVERFGATGVMAILHRSVGEPLGGPGSAGSPTDAPARPTTPRSTPSRIPTPSNELAAARAAMAKAKAAEASLLKKAEDELALLRKELAAALAKLRAEIAAAKAKLKAEEALLAKEEAALKKEEAALEKLAAQAVAARRAIAARLNALKSEAKRAEAEARNLAKHGDKLGPTLESLKKDGKSADQILKSASHGGGKGLGL